jgi:hypothetical protein
MNTTDALCGRKAHPSGHEGRLASWRVTMKMLFVVDVSAMRPEIAALFEEKQGKSRIRPEYVARCIQGALESVYGEIGRAHV